VACILLADPDEPTRNFMAMKLREAGYEVDVAHNGHEAIISDLELLGKSGLDLLREIRRHPDLTTMPFVLFTRADPGHKTDNGNYPSLMQELDALGATYLPKTASNLRHFPAIRIVK
jgi:CheY-like chemotaxis protein